MHRPDITRIAEQSKAKANYLEHMPAGYLILSALAGIYLGVRDQLDLQYRGAVRGSRLTGVQAGDGWRFRA